MNDTALGILMLAVAGLSLAIVSRALTTGRVTMGGGQEADRNKARRTYWALVALWSVSGVVALFVALHRLGGGFGL